MSKIIVSLVLIFIIIACVDFALHLSGINTQEYFQPRYYENEIRRENLTDYSFTEDFDNKMLKGLGHISNKRIVFSSLCRNAEKIIPHAFKNISNCVAKFKDYRVLIFENDSADNTRQQIKYSIEQQTDKDKWILMDCCSNGSCECILGISNPKSHGALSISRIEKMANYRNEVLNLVREKYKDFDYFVVYDFDIRGGIFMEGFFQTFHNYQDWDAVMSRGLKPFPFTYGLYNCVHDAQAYVKDNPGEYDDNVVAKFLNQQYYLRGSTLGAEYIKVRSAFNGLGIYKMNSVINSEYYPGKNNVLCEHVGLHENMIKLGNDKIFINQSLILQTGLENESMIPFYEYLSWFKKSK